MSPFESPRLPTEQIAALQAVDVHIYGGIHGTPETIESYGPACLGVEDGDYAGIEQFMTRLDPDRGDVLAFESIWYDPARDDAWFLARLQEIAADSPLINVPASDLTTFTAQVRRGQVLGPHDYAECLAILRSVRHEYADATQADKQQWKAEREAAGIFLPPGLHESAAFRDVKMTERLGAIAVTMNLNRPRRDRAILAFPVGHRHVTPVKRHLKANGVKAHTHTYSQNLRKRDGEGIAAIITGKDPKTERWIANARKILGG